MTLKELKESKQIPNIGDSELFKIVGEMLGENTSVDSLDFVLEDSMVEQIKYSPALIDMYIEQEMSKLGVDQVGQYKVVIDELKNREAEAEKAKAQALRITEQAKREAYQLLNELEELRKQQAKEKDAAEMARRARAAVKKGIDAIDSAADPIIGTLDSDED